MKQSDDHSLFAWVDAADTETSRSHHGLLATSPSLFAQSHNIIPYQDWEPRPPYSMTNRGLHLSLHLTRRDTKTYIAALDCPAPPDYEDSSFLAIYLKKLSGGDEQYARINVSQLAKVNARGSRQSIFVRQRHPASELLGAFPNHAIQLLHGPSQQEYKFITVIAPSPGEQRPIQSSRYYQPPGWIPTGFPITFRLPKGPRKVACALMFQRDDNMNLLVILGSAQELQLGFDAISLSETEFSSMAELSISVYNKALCEKIQETYIPKPLNEPVISRYHHVQVSAEPQVHGQCKYYLVGVNIDAREKVVTPSSLVIEQIEKVAGRSVPVPMFEKEPGQIERKTSQRKTSVWKRVRKRDL
jgi:hypothetical protein